MKRFLPLLLLLFVAACSTQPAEPPASAAGNPAAAGVSMPTVAVDSRMLDTATTSIPLQGEVAPDFSYTFADGATRRLSDLRGRKVLINFWATWCGPCEEEMPYLQRLEQDHDIVVLGVNKLELAEVIPPFAQERGLTFTLIANPSGDISERYGAKNIPLSYFLNTDGTIAFRQLGIMAFDEMVERVNELR